MTSACGKDDGADVAAFHDDSTVGAHLSLKVEPSTRELGVTETRRGFGDVAFANTSGHVAAVQQDAIPFTGWDQFDFQAAGEFD